MGAKETQENSLGEPTKELTTGDDGGSSSYRTGLKAGVHALLVNVGWRGKLLGGDGARYRGGEGLRLDPLVWLGTTFPSRFKGETRVGKESKNIFERGKCAKFDS